LADAHSAVARQALADPALTGMGTTLEIVCIRDTRAELCHLGDSRVYLFRDGVLRQITTDDNYAAVLVRRGTFTADDVPAAYRHILTQAVGVSDELVPELHSFPLMPGDLLLVCSDGLTAALDDGEIGALFRRVTEPAEIADSLIAAANDRGGPDNVSVIVIGPVPL
jgi:protein phosphatase